MYAPLKLYGFVRFENEDQIFFHVRNFRWGAFKQKPPPIIGERVLVQWDSSQKTDKAPAAQLVQRIDEPVPLIGVIETFDEQKGFGFIRTSDQRSHFLHRSEVLGKTMPQVGMKVTFFEGFKRGRSRACYVRIQNE